MAREYPEGFYVYLHIREDDGLVFYVGKGKGKRAWERSMRNRHWHFVANKHGFVVKVIDEKLSQDDAFALERYLIESYRSIGTGIVNVSDGGDGGTGKRHSDEWKAHIRERMLVKNPMSNPIVREKQKQAVRDAVTTKEARQRASKSARKNRARTIICIDNGMVFHALIDATNWIRNNGFPKASSAGIHYGLRKDRRAYGYSWKDIGERNG